MNSFFAAIRPGCISFAALLLIVLCPLRVDGQTAGAGKYATYIKNIDTFSGLPDNSVNAMAEDEYGLMWIGTWKGLTLYDGKHFRVFRHVDDNPKSLVNDMIRDILPVRGGVWVGTDNGLDFYDFGTDTFLHSVMEDAQGGESPMSMRICRLAEGPGGIFALTIDGVIFRLTTGREWNSRGGALPRFRRIDNKAVRKYMDMAIWSDGRIMALSDHGISVMDAYGRDDLVHNNIPFPYDPNMNLHIDTVQDRVYVGGGIGYPTRTFAIEKGNGMLRETIDDRTPDNVMDMRTLPHGGTVFATDGQGVVIMTHDGQKRVFDTGNSLLPVNAIYSVYVDRRGNLWIGTYRRGLCLLADGLNRYRVFNRDQGQISHDIVTALCEGPDGNLYIALDGGGMDVYNRRTGNHVNYNTSNSTIPGNNVTALICDGRKVWMTVYGKGLVEFDIASRVFTAHPLDESVEPGNKVWTLIDDRMGHIYVGGRALSRYDKVTGQFATREDCRSLAVSAIADNGHQLIVGTAYQGVLIIDKNTSTIVKRHSPEPSQGGVRLPGHVAGYVYLDSSGILWVSLSGKGLVAIDSHRGNKLKVYGAQQGLIEQRVSSMAEDSNGNLWIGTANGLFRYLRGKDSFVKISDPHLPQTYTASSAVLVGDTVYMGSTSGFLGIPYSLAETSGPVLPTLVTELQVMTDSHRLIPLYGIENGKIRLGSDENFFTIYFSVPEMVNPEQIRIQCRLKGLESDWRDVTETLSAVYTNVPSGEYVLQVHHADMTGEWSEPVEIPLSVAQPWYARAWAVSLWILLLAGGCFIGWRMYSRNKQNREKVQADRREMETAKKINDAKFNFYANISHELRTPCFLISAQIEELLNSPDKPVKRSVLQGIYRNSMRLNKLINHIIDTRKIDTGNVKLQLRPTELPEFLECLVTDYAALCAHKDIKFEFEHGPECAKVLLDPDKLEFIVTNLVTNSFKYTNRGGLVRMSLLLENERIIIKVSDNGIGIRKEMQEAIFEPFTRTDRGEVAGQGDGIGLSFVKELVELHGGSISVESEVNRGSEFTVTLPLRLPENSELSLPGEGAEREVLSIEPPVADRRSRPENPTAIHSVLIVDDDPEVASVLASAFDSDYNVVAVKDGKEAIRLARTGDYGLLITDMMMPDVSGHDVIKAVREDPSLGFMKIMVLSALGTDEEMLKAYDEGADLYVTKPISMTMLKHNVQQLLERRGNVQLLTADSRVYSTHDQQFLLKCRNVIDDMLNDADFDVNAMAARMAMSHSSLYKKIKKITGMSVVEFINEYKIYRAATLFMQGETNVQTVSDKCGFRDVKTFRETFKRKMNITPKQYITSLHNK